MATKEVKTEEKVELTEEQKEKIEQAVAETKNEMIVNEKGFWAKAWHTAKKLAKALALPIGVVIGWFLKGALSANGNNDGDTTDDANNVAE